MWAALLACTGLLVGRFTDLNTGKTDQKHAGWSLKMGRELKQSASDHCLSVLKLKQTQETESAITSFTKHHSIPSSSFLKNTAYISGNSFNQFSQFCQ
ncbi:hypothetical protein BaRGS_00004963 [Batillaria attramentaria]|uniref:Uncharacterized protein n=1 Tax=Batillaria attramentaria TaxID=370345 RepID=A0ABD0LW31_9CAEN